MLQSAVETSRPFIEAGKHELTLSAPSDSLYVSGDLTRLAQVIANLLNNAAKYTPEGGRIELRIEKENDRVVIRVSDNGLLLGRMNRVAQRVALP